MVSPLCRCLDSYIVSADVCCLCLRQTDFYYKQQPLGVSSTKDIYYGLAEVTSRQIKVQNFMFLAIYTWYNEFCCVSLCFSSPLTLMSVELIFVMSGLTWKGIRAHCLLKHSFSFSVSSHWNYWGLTNLFGHTSQLNVLLLTSATHLTVKLCFTWRHILLCCCFCSAEGAIAPFQILQQPRRTFLTLHSPFLYRFDIHFIFTLQWFIVI